ncbi:MFS transporter [Providencia sp. Me31A]|uniref:MFS transporter n=1 Tax=Providencia sp. Me31A TaxID=3392637 RepID=UPI003D2B5B28
MTQNNQQGWSILLTGKNLWLTLALAGGICLHAINVYITITTLPSVVRDIGGLQFYAWNTTLFILSSIILSVLTSQILNHLGPKRSYLLATVIFLIGSVICAITPSMLIMLIGRIIQGAGGGILLTLSYSMVHIVFPQHLWSKVLAMMSSMWGMATLLGPALGGFFAEYAAWRGAFWCLVFVGIPYLWLTWQTLPSHNLNDKDSQPAIPVQALMLLSAAVLAISLGSLSKERFLPIIGMLAAILLCIRLAKLERSAKNTLFPRSTFHFKAQLAPIYLTMALLGLSVQTEVFVPYFLQTLHGTAPLLSGYLAALVGAGWSISAIISSSLKPEHAIKTIRIGPCFTFSALVILALFMTNTLYIGNLQIWVICLALFITGASIGATWPHLLTRVLQVSIGPESQKASSAITTLQLFSTAFGASLAGLIANLAGLSTPGGIEGAQSAAGWLFNIFSLVPLFALMTANIVANRMKNKEKKGD